MTSTSNADVSKKNPKGKSNEEIVLAFQKLRSEQRFLSTKLNSFELDLQEHRVVLDALKELDEDRKCFKMVGGILCERTIKDVIPNLESNAANISKLVENFNKKLLLKESEINKFKDEHNVRLRYVDELSLNENEINKSTNESQTATTGNVGSILVP